MRARRGQGGFVLAAVIWFVAILALAAAVMSGWMADAYSRADLMQDQAAARAERLSAAQYVAYRMSSNYFSLRGLENFSEAQLAAAQDPLSSMVFPPVTGGTIALDGTPYRWRSSVVQLQDDAGLYNLNAAEPAELMRLLQSYGLDYRDTVDLQGRLTNAVAGPAVQLSLNGNGSAAPLGQMMRTPWEAFSLDGWSRQAALWGSTRSFARISTASLRLRMLNVNTAPRGALYALAGMDERAADGILRYRAARPILSQDDLNLAAGKALTVDPFSVGYAPIPQLRLIVTAHNDPLMHVLAIRLTPRGVAPFQFDYEIAYPADSESLAALARTDLVSLPGAPDAETRRPAPTP